MVREYIEAGMGQLFYLMGPSGSGKDSLMTGLREQLDAELSLLFAHRYITRPWRSGGENHIELSDTEFSQRLRAGCFAMHWEANGSRYGIGSEIQGWLTSGHSVLVNGSREHYLQSNLAAQPHLIPILISVDSERLRQRLLQRGRETLDQIEQRLERNITFQQGLADNAIIIDNSGALADAVHQLRQRLIDRLLEAQSFG